METKGREAKENKKAYALIKVKPKYAEEFCIMMVACKALCTRASESKNLATIDEVFSVLGPFDFLLELSGEGKNEEEMDEKINKTIFKIRETLGSYIYDTCTLTTFELSEFFEDFLAKVCFEKAKSLETEKKDDELKALERYLFSWKSVPGDDIERLIGFLRDDLDIIWAENAEIHKSVDDKTIHIKDKNKRLSYFIYENKVEITLDKKGEKATLKISDGRSLDLKVKKENGGLNLYKECFKKEGTFDSLDHLRKKLDGDNARIQKPKAKNITKDVHVLIKIKPEYTEEFYVAITVFKGLYNRAHQSKNLAKIHEVSSVLGPCDFLLKIIGEEEKITKTLFDIRETLGSYINETLTLTKFKIPMTREGLENFFEKKIGVKNLVKLPDADGETIPDESLKPDDEIDLKEMYDAETTSLKNLLKEAKKSFNPEYLKKEIDNLTERIEELEKKK